MALSVRLGVVSSTIGVFALLGSILACSADAADPESGGRGGSTGSGGNANASGGVATSGGSGAIPTGGAGGIAGNASGGSVSGGGSGGSGDAGTNGASGAAGSVSAGGVGGDPMGSGGAGTGNESGSSNGGGGSGGSGGSAVGSAGTNGAGGSKSTGLVGWASVAPATTGGEGGEVIDVDTIDELVAAVTDDTARIVRVSGTITVNFANLVDINSNKTVIGVGNNATIVGGLKIDGENNVIVQNLKVNAKTASGVGDGITINTSHHVWVDHCEVWDAPDGNLDITDGSDYVTVSWTKFYYSASPGAENHRFSNLIGGSDTSTTDTNKLRVTYHHNWWVSRIVERAPRGRFGLIHVFNNYYTTVDPGQTAAVRAGTQSRLLVQNNYFDGTQDPHRETEDGKIVQSGNAYNNVSGDQQATGTFMPSLFTYPFTLDAADAIPALVSSGAGPQP
jgi:pectate lyase